MIHIPREITRRTMLSALAGVATLPILESATVTANPTEKHLFINGTDENDRAQFTVSATGSIRSGWSTNGSIDGRVATGDVWGTWEVDYFFTGEIDSLSTDGEVFAYVDTGTGLPEKITAVSAVDPPGQHLFIKGVGPRTFYDLTVSGELQPGWSPEGDDIILDEGTVSGNVWGGKWDDYFFTGTLESIQFDGEAELYVDGTKVNPATIGQDDAPQTFTYVTTAGDSFALDGQKFVPIGTNSFWCSYLYWDHSTIDETFSDLAEMGQNTLRLWGFGSGSPGLFEPAPGEYNENAFERLDYVIKKAGEYDIKLVIALGNYWEDFGGIDQYIEWSETATERSDFYRDEDCQAMYRTYVEYVLTRVNTYTGIEYRDDPSIVVWELLNELRDPAAPEGNGDVLHNWAHETAEFVKSIDGNHLVSTGAEGFVLGLTTEYDDIGYWMNTQGYDFVDLHASEYIDVASIHLYPDHWGISNESAIQFIRDRAYEAANQLQKPVYVGEFGKTVDRGAADSEAQLAERDACYADWYATMAAENVDGAMFWHHVTDANYNSNDVFATRYPEDASTIETIESGSESLSR